MGRGTRHYRMQREMHITNDVEKTFPQQYQLHRSHVRLEDTSSATKRVAIRNANIEQYEVTKWYSHRTQWLPTHLPGECTMYWSLDVTLNLASLLREFHSANIQTSASSSTTATSTPVPQVLKLAWQWFATSDPAEFIGSMSILEPAFESTSQTARNVTSPFCSQLERVLPNGQLSFN